nr:acetyl-CoA carboxylase biotin carboxyl carrier protein [Candidatus Eremiobacteraeota bacterium]
MMDETQTLKELLEIMEEHDLDALKITVGDQHYELVRREPGMLAAAPASVNAAAPATAAASPVAPS